MNWGPGGMMRAAVIGCLLVSAVAARGDGAANAGATGAAPARFPPKEALESALTPQGALGLWAQFSRVLRDRMQHANKKSALIVMAPLNGSDMTAARAATDAQRGAALAQIQATCSVFLTTPGIPLTADERDLLAAYAARVGEVRQPKGGKD